MVGHVLWSRASFLTRPFESPARDTILRSCRVRVPGDVDLDSLLGLRSSLVLDDHDLKQFLDPSSVSFFSASNFIACFQSSYTVLKSAWIFVPAVLVAITFRFILGFGRARMNRSSFCHYIHRLKRNRKRLTPCYR